ncbi:MAG: Gx transporter family protein [Spirochaetaceae bacterium]|nr:Gx transporter family protein [Spirochaetaceae bacterium]
MAYRRRIICVAGAFCAFLAVFDHLIPRPLPFLRLGLANMPLMLALFLDLKSFALLVVVKVLSGALLSGALFSYLFLFSAAGSAASACVMFALYRLTGGCGMSFTGLGVSGALASNVVQLLLARVFVLGQGAVYIAPPFLAFGVASGFALGVLCNVFSARSRWYRAALAETADGAAVCGGVRAAAGERALTGERALAVCERALAGERAAVCERAAAGERALAGERAAVRAKVLFFAGAAASVVFSLTPSLPVKCAEFALILVVFIAAREKNNFLLTALFVAGIVGAHLVFPHGRVLWQWGGLRISAGALAEGFDKALSLEGLILISRLCVRKELRFPGLLGSLLCDVFALFSRLREMRGMVRRGALVESIDTMLFDLTRGEAGRC